MGEPHLSVPAYCEPNVLSGSASASVFRSGSAPASELRSGSAPASDLVLAAPMREWRSEVRWAPHCLRRQAFLARTPWRSEHNLGRSRVGQDGTPTSRFAQETTDPLAFQGIEDDCPERFFGRAKILCKPNRGTQRAIDEQLTSGLSARRWPLFVLGG